LARGLTAWSAVVAQEQAVGRGQAERTFQSDPGGLYVTAVLPYAGNPLASRGFALAVGWAVCELLRELGVVNIRLRWPNDLMVGARKVGGILVEQGGPDTLLVGIGLNVTNRPWLADSTLVRTAGRLVDAVTTPGLPDPGDLAERVLEAIRTAHDVFAHERLAGLVPRLEACWGEPWEVEIEAARGVALRVRQGRVRGIDAQGCILLETMAGTTTPVPAHHIGRLREVASGE
jgi:BirA family biotin operon repressor/biotin-[acetyl-CoA-carboxylase] ligase